MMVIRSTEHVSLQPDPDTLAARDPVPADRSARAARAARADRVIALQARALQAEFLVARQATLIEVLARALDEPTLAQALDALVMAVQQRIGADRVAVALADGEGALHLAAVSQQAVIEMASGEARLLVAAMEEAVHLEQTVRLPGSEERFGVLEAHRSLGARRAGTALVSLPMYHDAQPIGALLVERHDAEPFLPSTLELLEQLAHALAPVLVLRRDAARGVREVLRRASLDALEPLLGADRALLRPGLIGAGILVALAVLVPIERHVVATAELVPLERRMVSAPIDGFVDEVTVSAGDRVVAGQLLARLDRRELDLEAALHDSEITRADTEFRDALASRDRKATAIARARLTRQRTLRDLVAQRIDRTELRAAIDGRVISGDPSEASGMPVARGDTLFEIAPAEGYEVHLLVDESDIGRVREGQRGGLALRARPGDALALEVAAIHPVAESEAGANRFRVEAELVETAPQGLRPGQSGTARLSAGRESVAARLLRPLARRAEQLRWRYL